MLLCNLMLLSGTGVEIAEENSTNTERFSDLAADAIRRRSRGVIGQVRVSAGGCDVFVTQELPDQHQPFPPGHADTGEAVPKVMDAHIRKLGLVAMAIQAQSRLDTGRPAWPCPGIPTSGAPWAASRAGWSQPRQVG